MKNHYNLQPKITINIYINNSNYNHNINNNNNNNNSHFMITILSNLNNSKISVIKNKTFIYKNYNKNTNKIYNLIKKMNFNQFIIVIKSYLKMNINNNYNYNKIINNNNNKNNQHHHHQL
jgi:hypothetical protein